MTAEIEQFNYLDQHRRFDLGDQVAQNDSFLEDSFVQTTAFPSVERATPKIFVGRKGSGKSALRIHFEKNPKDRIAISIEPQDAELINLFSELVENSIYSFSTEVISDLWEASFWLSAAHALIRHCKHKIEQSHQNGDLMELIELLEIAYGDLPSDWHKRLSDLVKLYSNQNDKIIIRNVDLDNIKSCIEQTLNQLDKKIYILVDSVDDNVHNILDTKSRNDLFATYFEGLLNSFRRFTNKSRNPLAESIILKLFLPTDIFDWSVARHHDHLRQYIVPVDWRRHQLEDFIITRFMRNLPRRFQETLMRISVRERNEIVWKIFLPGKLRYHYHTGFDERSREIDTSRAVLDMSLNRPRDLLEVVRQIYEKTIESGVRFPSVDEIDSGFNVYSFSVKRSVISEYQFVCPEIESAMNGISGLHTHIENSLLRSTIQKVTLNDDSRTEYVLNILYDSGVLGVVNNDEEKYYFDYPHFDAVKKSKTFCVHRAFWHSLNLSPVIGRTQLKRR